MFKHLDKALAELHSLQLRRVKLCQLNTESQKSPGVEDVELHPKKFCENSLLLSDTGQES